MSKQLNAENDGLNPTENDEKEPTNAGTADGDFDQPAGESDTFPREYVEGLRRESADYQTRAEEAEKRVDTLAKRLHRELVAATGRLENAADLPFDAKHLDDTELLVKALDALLTDRPYMAKRKVTGDAGQGSRGGAPQPFSLIDALKG